MFVHYEGKRADDIAASRFAVRQLVAQAVSHAYRIPRKDLTVQMDAEIARRKGTTENGISGAEQLKGAYNAAK